VIAFLSRLLSSRRVSICRRGFQKVNDTLLECRGLLYAYDSLYANANNSKGMYPWLVVSEKYRNVQIVTNDGRTITGRAIASGDHRSSIVRVATDPLKPTQVVEISKRDIEIHRDSMLSPMPDELRLAVSVAD